MLRTMLADLQLPIRWQRAAQVLWAAVTLLALMVFFITGRRPLASNYPRTRGRFGEKIVRLLREEVKYGGVFPRWGSSYS